MTLLDLVVRTPVSEALGWTLFHSLWEGVLIAAAFGALLVAVRSPRIRYAAGCIALLAIIASFVVTLIHFLPENGSGARTLAEATLPPWRELADANEGSGHFPNFVILVPWLGPLWLSGVCLFYLRYASGWLSLRTLRSRGICKAPESWQLSVRRLTAELQISRPVVLLESLLADTPVVLGHLRPVVLVPLGFLAGLPPDHVEAILLHELAHIRRSDYLVNVCQRAMEGLFFYHPAVWWISRVVRVERENCCDDVVVALRGDAHGYAAALAELEQNRLEQRWTTREPALAATGGNLMKRIKRLLYPKAPSGIWAPALAAFVLFASSGMLLAAWRANPNPNPAVQQAESQFDSPWRKWLSEDVVYIISDQEKAAFERLKTDEERQQFVDQFWARRDPTPGTPENEFKEEHYRRIAYANQHFRTVSGTPAWRTDRGHMYIVYGPPDEIDSHPKRADNAYGIEMWRYRYVEGLGNNGAFTFIDRTGGGDYHLAPVTGR
jgi:GWxTD domain-containing protein